MRAGPMFMKLRTVAFACISLVSLTWVVLLCLELFLRWDVSDSTQRSLVSVMILIDTITAIMLPTLLIVEFRAWLDAVRMLFLLMAHFGVAIGFTTGVSNYTCPEDTPDDEAVCKMVDMFILLGSWVNPALLVSYSVCLAAAVYYSRGKPQAFEKGSIDPEAATPTQAELPMMAPPRDRSTVSSVSHMYSATRTSRMSFLQVPSALARYPIAENQDEEGGHATEKDNSPRSSARLSKRLPARFF